MVISNLIIFKRSRNMEILKNFTVYLHIREVVQSLLKTTGFRFFTFMFSFKEKEITLKTLKGTLKCLKWST